jgi:hypothetical protein
MRMRGGRLEPVPVPGHGVDRGLHTFRRFGRQPGFVGRVGQELGINARVRMQAPGP